MKKECFIVKSKAELPNCPVGKKVRLIYGGNSAMVGIFKGMDGPDTIMLRSIDSSTTMGFSFDNLLYYLEEEGKP